MKSTHEIWGGKYQQAGDYLLHNLEAPESPKVGIWGEHRRKYLREHQKALSFAGNHPACRSCRTMPGQYIRPRRSSRCGLQRPGIHGVDPRWILPAAPG